MSNGRLVPPQLDDRTWQQLVDEAKMLIPKYAPEWTDHNPSDLGITLIELFAWLSEQTIYRLNQVPDKNYIKFLDLIGVRRDPPTPAQAEITFKIAGDAAVSVPKATQVSTAPVGTQDGLVFETEEQLNAINIKKCIFLDEGNVYTDFTAKLLQEPFVASKLDLPANKPRRLLLGFATAPVLPLAITFRVKANSNSVQPVWKYSTTNSLAAWSSVPQVTKPNFSFKASDRVGLQVPADWSQSSPADWGANPKTDHDKVSDSLYWIALELKNTAASDKSVSLDRIAANIMSAVNVITVQNESLGTSNGQAFQTFAVKNAPLYEDLQASNPLRHLVVSVFTGGTWEVWKRVDDFTGGNKKEYLCDPTTGEISFGNYTDKQVNPGSGMIPPAGSLIQAITYRYVAGGSNGNVPSNTIVIQRTPVAGVISVKNEIKAINGSDWEDIEDTKRRGPQTLQTRDRAVTVKDYEYLARRASTDVAKVRCLPPKRATPTTWVTLPFERTPGKVNIIVVPNISNDPGDRNEDSLRKPVPSAEVLKEIKDYLDERRTITSVLVDPWPPFYVEVFVTATVYVKPGQDKTIIRQTIQNKLFDFFHPVSGGPGAPEGKGWDIGQHVYIPEVFSVIESVPEVSYIFKLQIGRVGSSPVEGVRLEVQEHEIICASKLDKDNANYAITVEEEQTEL